MAASQNPQKSPLPGDFFAQKKNGTIYYRSSITHLQKHISLGSYDDCQAANAAYEEARRLLDHPEILFDPQYPLSALSFEKYVILMNFRDNRYYFKNPIYAYAKYFLYFLSPDHILKFDTDDLFYYASHKIMKRGGHLFFADYGMQVSLLSRYGIRPYAVEGRDYRFINGDPNDFRYENIQILLPYHGVQAILRPSRIRYKTVIHIRSNYVVGIYDSMEQAAIAYNKAVDILKRNGFKRQFLQNYIETLSPSEYASVYTEISVSEKIQKLKPGT